MLGSPTLEVQPHLSRRLLEPLGVEAGAERAPGAGHHNRPDLGVGAGAVEELEVLPLHGRAPGVPPFGVVEGQGADATADLVADHARRLLTHGGEAMAHPKTRPARAGSLTTYGGLCTWVSRP